MSGIHLLKNFIRSPQATGAIWPSSKYLSEAMISGINIESAENIAELGPGTGVITEKIIKKIKPESKFFIVELNKDLYNLLKTRHSDVIIFNDSAANLVKLKDNLDIDLLDVIVSSLPWAAFPLSLQKSIMEAVIESLAPDGIFTTFAYLQGALLPTGINFNKLLKSYFRKVKISKVIWRNLPPAFIYRCVKQILNPLSNIDASLPLSEKTAYFFLFNFFNQRS